MRVEDLKVGGLYTTEEPRREAIELFKSYHHRYEAENMYTDNVLLKDEYFLLLEKKDLTPASMCLKVLTSAGEIGWTTYLHRNKRMELVRFKTAEV